MGITSAYVRSCVEAVEKITYGRDNRRPIADAIEQPTKYDYVEYLNDEMPLKKEDEALAKLNNRTDEVIAEVKAASDALCDEVAPQIIELQVKESKRVVEIKPVVQKDYVDWIERKTTATGLSLISLSDDEYQFGSSKDDESVELIEGDDYILNLTPDTVTNLGDENFQPEFGDNTWEIDPDGSVVACEYIPHYEHYMLVIARANGM